ncbi:hypothetical protein [Stutzerimonas nitrititolerans]|uniref:hypothetical protein n=1 Tax=Stutzerimonas nitrititolerans TaxID=2482751 RepID=UPI001BDBECF2|nr:hypothetical protein [Stutzerimonas nitrititolerans]MBT1120726.1 hypothetical protein [Stutzerimonas nitrititolerans]
MKGLDPEAIKELADNIRVIENFAGNSGFDKDLLMVKPVAPVNPDSFLKKHEKWVAKTILLSVFLLLVSALVLEWVTGKHALLVFVVGMIVTVIGSCYLHKLYGNVTFTTIAGVGGLLILLVAVGVVSPQQISQGLNKKYIEAEK